MPSRRPFSLLPLGGYGEFGRNCTLLFADELTHSPCIAVDCGCRIADAFWPGIDLQLPDLDVFAEHAKQLQGYLLTHGHEDHIGGLVFALRRRPAPVYASHHSLELLRNRLEAAGMPFVERHELKANTPVDIGPFRVTPIQVSHSIPGSFALSIERGAERIVFSGDYRNDQNPVLGPATDIEALSALGQQGVTLLVADSTGSLVENHNPGEHTVYAPLFQSLRNVSGRIVITTFPSHVQRVHQIVDIAQKLGRRILVLGRSAKEHVALARREALINVEPHCFVDETQALKLAKSQLLILATGCQGESNAALTRIAYGSRELPPIEPGDYVVFSARIIPGHEQSVMRIANILTRLGATLIWGNSGVHVSGHAYSQDLAWLIKTLQPELFMPGHGDRVHLEAHATLAESTGIGHHRIALVENGQPIQAYPQGNSWQYRGTPPLELNELLVERGIELHASDALMSERRTIGRFGVISVALPYSQQQRRRNGSVVLTSAGFASTIYADALDSAKSEVESAVDALKSNSSYPQIESCALAAVKRGLRRCGLRAPPLLINLVLTQ